MAPPPRIGICFICHGAIWENPVVMGCPTRHESHVGCLVALLLDPGAPCPPQCCRHLRLTAEMVRQLGREGVEAFLEKRERAARVYCSRPACRAWIPHPRVIYKLAICGLAECGALTCAQCRAPYHGEHSPCTSAMATTKEAVTCTSCGCKIERVAGWDEIGYVVPISRIQNPLHSYIYIYIYTSVSYSDFQKEENAESRLLTSPPTKKKEKKCILTIHP